MGLADMFGKEDRIEVAFSTFYGLMKNTAKYEIAMRGIATDIPHEYMRKMLNIKIDGEEDSDEELQTD